MRSGVPWSVKGIEPEAREAAKQAAQRAGVTLGAWLNQMIMDAGTDEVGRAGADMAPRIGAQAPFAHSVFSQPTPVDLAPVAEAMREIVGRVESSERRTTDLARRLEQTVGQLAERLDHSERAMEHVPDQRTLDPLERKIQQLAERLEESERGRGGRRGSDDKAIQTLEKAVSAVVDHLDTAERRTEESLAEIRQTLAKVAHRVEQRDEEEEREEAQARSRALETHLQTLAGRLEKMEHSVSGVSAQAVETALKAIADKTDEEQHKATIAALQRNLGEITHRLERAEQRTDETLKTFEMTVTSIAKRLDDLDTPRPQNDVAQIVDARLTQVTERLHDNEEMTLQAVQTIERAIAGMSDSLHVAENRSRETIESLHVMLERMTDRLGRLEKETKAARAQPAQMLPTQISVGQGAGSGFVPGAQGFPIPNFDQPPMGGFGAPSAEFRNPFAETGFAEPRTLPSAPSAPPSPASVTPERIGMDRGDVPPPPFATPGDEGELELREAEPTDFDPAQEQAHAAHDFLAAARRAAQAAAQNGRGPQQPGQAPYADTARFTAFDNGSDTRRKRIVVGLLAAVILAAAGLATVRYLNNQPLVPVIDATGDGTPKTVEPATAKPADMDAGAEKTPADAVTVPGAPSAQEHPEATPDDAGANGAAPSGAAAPASTTPTAKAPEKPAAEAPIVPAPKAAAPQSATTIPRAEAKGPTVTPAPAKPVTTAPIGQTSGQTAAPTGDRALRAAAARGEAAAQYEVGQRYANGDGVTADLSQAAYWYGQAADQGLAIAQYRLATLYEKGRGVAQDDVQARKWYEKAATQGNMKAMHNLAVIYAEGRGTRQDFTTAARWFGEAADFGLGDSQYNLAILRERGLGVQQDYASAYKWLSIAAKGGDKGAAQKRDQLAAKLDAATLAQAKVAAETWTPKRPDPLANGDLSSLPGGAPEASQDTTGSLAGPQNDVGRAQAMLMKLGYDPGSSDGMMGPRTRDAILAYQRSAGLDATGNADRALLKSLELATQ